jgi:DNA-binding transcriptional LysR family regulator
MVEGKSMENRDWIILRELYEKKNITKAAESLFISQPALTSRLQQMEKEFNVKIVNRGRRGVQFTPQGEYLVKYSEEMIGKYRSVKENLQNMNERVVGTLRLGVSNFFTKYKLPALLKKFKEKFPAVEYEIITGWSKDMYQAVYNHDVHLAFIRGEYAWSEKKILLFEEAICVASKNEIDINNLPNLPKIDYETDQRLRDQVDQWWAETYNQPPNVYMTVNQVDTCKEMVMNDLGYGIMPSMLLEDSNDLFRIDLIDKNGKQMVRKTWMYYDEQTLDMRVVKVFVDFVKEEFKNN